MHRVPAAIRRRAQQQQLGRLQGVYTYRWRLPLGYYLGPLLILVGAFVGLIATHQVGSVLPWVLNWVIAINGVGLLGLSDGLVLLVGMAWVLVGGWMVIATRLGRMMGIFVYEEGLIAWRGRATVVSWQQVVSLWKEVQVDGGTTHVSTLQCADETLVRFDGELMESEDLGTLLDETVTCRLLPAVIAAFDAGASVTFAELVLSTRGVGLKQTHQFISWWDVARVTIDDRALTLYHTGSHGIWATVQVAALPNLGVLKALLAYGMRDLSQLRVAGVLATYEAGLALDFGALRVTLQGVEVVPSGVQLRWGEMASIAVGEREVMMRRLGSSADWYVIPLTSVYDAPLLKAVLDSIVERTGHQ